MTTRARGEFVGQTDTVQLHVLFRGTDGLPADLDSFPQITIIQPSGNVALGPTSAGVYRLTTGAYGYDLAIGFNDSLGVWTDFWRGTLDGYVVTGTLNFVVSNTQMPGINTDGYIKLGDDPGFDYSQAAIMNINKLLKALKVRLSSSGKAKVKDAYGNEVFVDCDIFSVDTLVTALGDSLGWFNEIQHLTQFTFDDASFVDQFFHILVQGATIICLASKALIERGREFVVTDNGINFNVPTVSELLSTEWSAELTNHTERLKYIKAGLKPSPLGMGLIGITSARNPIVSQLKHRRARQII